jgi:hypothetical protein
MKLFMRTFVRLSVVNSLVGPNRDSRVFQNEVFYALKHPQSTIF